MRILKHFATLVVCTIILAAMSLTCPGCVVDKEQAAEREAASWISKLGADDVIKVVCNGTDSDDDGYVSCTLVYKGGAREQVECACGPLPWHTGCRQPKVAPSRSTPKIYRQEAASSEREL